MFARDLSTLIAFLSLMTLAGCGHFSYGLVVESVNSYSSRYGANTDIPNSVANGDGFIQGMTQPGSPWTLSQRWTENAVFDTDFVDPDTAGPQNFDTLYFDKQGTAISYFTGHGTCSGCSQATACSGSSQCINPNAGAGERLPGACRFAPGLAGTCCYNTDRFLFTNSSSDRYNGNVDYSNGFVKWGENATSAGWAGAGTNGGTHLVILDISCGVLAPFWAEQLQPTMAGIHMLATIMPTNGDTANVSDRGATFAQRWAANPSGAVSAAWLDTLASLAQRDGGPCATGDYKNGGGHGLNGCGCNFIIAFDDSAAGAAAKINENWTSLRDNDRAAKGANWWEARWLCNYALSRGDRFAFVLP